MTRHGSQDINSGQKPEFRTLETAYWGWVDNTCSFPRGSNKRKHWLKDNAAFEMNGTIYTRSAHPMWSNSGKSITGWLRSFTGSDRTWYRMTRSEIGETIPIVTGVWGRLIPGAQAAACS